MSSNHSGSDEVQREPDTPYGCEAGSTAPHRDVSRRAFLVAVTAGMTAVCARQPYRPDEFAKNVRSPVGLFDAPNYAIDIADVIARGLGHFDLQVRGRRVFLKPNLVEYQPGVPINTHPAVVAGAAVAFLRAGAHEVVVGEGPGHVRDIEYLLAASGLLDCTARLGLRFIDLNHDDVARVPLRSHFTGLSDMALPVSLLQSDVIVSMPKLKTHHFVGLTGSMKNLFGVVPGALYGWPKNLLHARGIVNSILDLNATVRPDFAIVDAIVAMEGNGPIAGRPRAAGFLAMGPDLVAVDATCARVIGLDVDRVPYLADASRFLGNAASDAIDQRGERAERFQTNFELPHLRRSRHDTQRGRYGHD